MQRGISPQYRPRYNIILLRSIHEKNLVFCYISLRSTTPRFSFKAQRVHVGIRYILRAQRGSYIPTLRPKYIPFTYMDPLGRAPVELAGIPRHPAAIPPGLCRRKGLQRSGLTIGFTLPETNMETQKGPYKDYRPSKRGLYGFPC